jgi:diguanylate cyclase (GGDEF)-like protein/PAS domain S-box-containing protein
LEAAIKEQQAVTGRISLTTDGKWLNITEEFCNLIGYSAEELQSISHSDLLPPHEAKRINTFHEQLVQSRFGPAKIETQYICKDGSAIRIELTSRVVEHGDAAPYLSLTAEDILSRERRADAARETAENYRLLVQNATEHAIIRLDEHGTVISWNPGAERILGYREEEIIGRPASLFFTPEDVASGVAEQEMDNARKAGRGEDERWQVRKNQTRFWASGIMTPLRNDEGNLQGYVKIFCDLTDKKINAERTLHLAQHDSLTGLPNRRKFHDELDHSIGRAKATRTELAVLFIDLDRFKIVNDSLGHHAGDQLLKCVAQRLTESVRKTDIIARLSGDEFGIICIDLHSYQEAEYLAAKLVKMMATPFSLGTDQVSTGASIGVTVFPQDAADATQLLINADLAMYRAKSQGRSAYVLYTERLNDEAARRHALDDASRLALTRKEFDVYYQPQISLETNRICGMEALLRWEDPGLPMVTISELVTLADDTGLIVPLGEWVLKTACTQLKVWHDMGFRDLRVAINMSYRQIKESNFLNMLDAVFAQTGVDPQCVELEITEGLLMENTSSNTAVLHALKEKGIRISIDDFGTGFSALSYLKNFPIDALKIDQAFVKHLPDNQNDASITSAIIGLGHSMNLTVIAEGIETKEQALFLRERNCDCAQGFFFSKAVPSDEITRILHERMDRSNQGTAAYLS